MPELYYRVHVLICSRYAITLLPVLPFVLDVSGNKL